jgi:class 3 adenylate cyclase/DNA polymerase III delta prime subunit
MIGTRLRGRYEIIQPLGRGGFGETYLARDRDLPGYPYCVVKQLKPQVANPSMLEASRRLFDTEARVLYQLGNHDQIPQLLAHFEDNQQFYLVQEHIEGDDLRHELAAGRRLDQMQAIQLVWDILEILNIVHQHQVIHRDIKPSNLIRRAADGKIILIDFGTVKQVTTATSSPTEVTIAIGTPGYMPPEQCAGKPRFSSDIHAVGMLGIQALTGVLPHHLPTDPKTGEILWRDQVAEASLFHNILAKMVCQDIRDRYDNVREVLDAIAALPSSATIPLPSQPLPRPMRTVNSLPSQLQTQRTLAAIAFTDGVGFSARMSADEEHTLDLIHRDLELMRRLCQQFSGQTIKSTGDGLLMYFPSAVLAVDCAIEIQKSLAQAAQTLSENDIILHRIGIHLGDVFVSEGDVMGNGVNIAARLEGKAQPGGICISQIVYDLVKNHLQLPTTFLGNLSLKNITDPVPSYLIQPVSSENRTYSPTHSPSKPKLKQTRQDVQFRHILLNKVRNYWIKGVLETSLHGRVLIELGLEERLDLVERPWELVWEGSGEFQQTLLPGIKVSEKFLAMGEGRSLLILGEPGSGKTTTLLELTRDLLDQADVDSNHPIPVVFNLSSWTGGKQTIADWLVNELHTKYQVSKDIGQTWIDSGELLLLLDGLDEVSITLREACVTAINEFTSEHGTTELVVCSRIRDYQALQQRLNLQAAICLQPLTLAQIDRYLNSAGTQLTVVRQVLRSDSTLQDLAQSPLMLSIITLAYQGISLDELPQRSGLDDWRKHLFDRYIQRMFKRRRGQGKYSQEQVINGLSWLAKRMHQDSETVFLIERLQPSWLDTKAQKWLYSLGVGLIGGLIMGLGGGLNVELMFWREITLLAGLIMGLGGGLMAGLIVALVMNQIEPVETLKWSWGKAKRNLLPGLRIGLTVGLIFGFTSGLIFWLITPSQEAIIEGLTYGLSGIGTGLIFVLLRGLTGGGIETSTVPNQGIWQSAQNTLIFALIGVVAMVGLAQIVGLPILFGAVIGLLFGLFSPAGIACIQHFTLRLVLYFSGCIPWNYARFLDYATQQIFLQKVGGGYIFIHRLLLEHFAQMERKM